MVKHVNQCYKFNDLSHGSTYMNLFTLSKIELPWRTPVHSPTYHLEVFILHQRYLYCSGHKTHLIRCQSCQKPHSLLRSKVADVKDTVKTLQLRNAIYQIPYSSWDRTNAGQTGVLSGQGLRNKGSQSEGATQILDS